MAEPISDFRGSDNSQSRLIMPGRYSVQFWSPSCVDLWKGISRLKDEISRLKDEISRLKIGNHQRKGTELDEVNDIWKVIRESKEVDDVRDIKTANMDIESTAKTNTFLSNSQTANIMWTGKSGAETNLLPPMDGRDREMEELSNFAFLGLMLSYAILYILYSANLGRKSNNRRVMIGLHVWTIFMMMLLLIVPYIRCSARAVKVARLVMSGLIFISSCIVFVLLQRAM